MVAVMDANTNGMKPFFKPASEITETAMPAGWEIRNTSAKMSIDGNKKTHTIF